MTVTLLFCREVSDDPEKYQTGERAQVSHVTEYYEHYVREKGLTKNFINGCIVTSVDKASVHPKVGLAFYGLALYITY